MEVRDWLGENNTIGVDIWEKKYRYGNETFDEWLERISNGNLEIKKLIIEKKFIFAGRILANRGLQNKGIKVTYSNCYVMTPPEDNLESIYETDKKLARTYSYGGGCGVDISKLAPNGARVRNAAKSTTGILSWMEQYSATTLRIAQNGRRGALMLSLDVNHPDVEAFINVKSDLSKVTGANISVRIDDDFMYKVINDMPHTLSYTRQETGQVIEREISARELFNKLVEMNWRTAEPGILFWDNISNWNLLSETEGFEYAGTNPCAEEPLPAGGSCLLSSINLSEFVKEPFTLDAYFDFEDFIKSIHISVREMNRILDEGLPLHPLQEQRDAVRDWRQIGLGILGLGDMFIKMGIRYGSDESIEMSDKIGRMMARESILESAMMAKKQGMFPKCSPSSVMKTDYYKNISDGMLDFYVGQYGLRNSQLLTIAPTGSISTMLSVSGGVEPLFATEYYRTTKSLHSEGDFTYKVYSDIVEECRAAQEWDEMPDYIVTSRNLHYLDRIKMQATWQKYIDAAISSTINLPQETTKEEVYDIYIEAWKNKLKGCTIYRSGGEREGILTVDGNADMPEVKKHLPEEIDGHDPEHALDSDGKKCPLCGAELEATNGCFVCPSCFMYSKCEL